MFMYLQANSVRSLSELFRMPNFFKGIARIVDTFSVLDNYNYSSSEAEADKKALKRDWEMVGFDLWRAIKNYESNSRKAK